MDREDEFVICTYAIIHIVGTIICSVFVALFLDPEMVGTVALLALVISGVPWLLLFAVAGLGRFIFR